MKTTKTETIPQDLIDYGVAKINDKRKVMDIIEELFDGNADADFIKTTFDMLVDEFDENCKTCSSGDVRFTFDDDQSFSFNWVSHTHVTPAEIRKIMADHIIGSGAYKYSYDNGGYMTTNVVVNTKGEFYYWDDSSCDPHYVTTLAEHRGVRKAERSKYAVGTVVAVGGLTRVIVKIGRTYHYTRVVLSGKIVAGHKENGKGYSAAYLDKNAKVFKNITVELPKTAKKKTVKDVASQFPVGEMFRDKSDGRTINVQKHGRTRIYYNNTWNCSVGYAVKNWVKPEDYKP